LAFPRLYGWWPRLPWRTVVRLWSRIAHWHERVFVMGRRATGGFAGALSVLSHVHRREHILLGRASALGIGLQQPVGIKAQRHLFMYAMTGAGKTTSLISILSEWPGSALVIDPKGQITHALNRHDRRRLWATIKPYSKHSARFNVFDILAEVTKSEGPDAAVLWAQRIAEALVITPPGSKQPYFTQTAQAYLAGLILFVYRNCPREQQDLGTVRDLIVFGLQVFNPDGREDTNREEAQSLLQQAMDECCSKWPEGRVIAGGAAGLISAAGETGGNVRSTLQQQTAWLDSPAVRRTVLGKSTFSLSDLKSRDDRIVTLCAPVLSIREELAPFARLLLNMTGYVFEAHTTKSKYPCLLIADELPSLGYNAAFETMLPVARSYGLLVLGVAQNVELMKKTYPNSYGSFTGEADAVLWMATNHNDTARLLSETLGNKTLIEIERDPKGERKPKKHYRDVKVMDPDQVRRFLSPESGHLIVTRAGGRPMKLKVEPCFKALPVWRYAPDPDHRESWPRRLSRALLGRPGPEPVQADAGADALHDEETVRNPAVRLSHDDQQ
ncbi:type IV secretory system conjugative DNA transfer family protein, partial [uncultured Abyssibacter sp.]|uniref:type IV secretory system conjugative DNA transfer family protein n=1 Tax=uncultured Abyssibacter sp. TaxID=2320202 RepID=UPI0032B26225